MEIRAIDKHDKILIRAVADVHVLTFKGFFLTFMGKGFLNVMYECYCEHSDSGLIGAFDDNNLLLGFLAYSEDMSGLYKYMLRKKLFVFAWYSFLAFIKEPKIFIRLLRALGKPSESKRDERYVELSSIGVRPEYNSLGIGTQLITYLKQMPGIDKYKYISLETDAVDNDRTNLFYKKNGFVLFRVYFTAENRKMNEYHWEIFK